MVAAWLTESKTILDMLMELASGAGTSKREEVIKGYAAYLAARNEDTKEGVLAW